MNQPTWQDLPNEIQEEMLNEQERQGNKRDAGVFKRDLFNEKEFDGFDWDRHEILTYVDWDVILRCGNFAPFYEKFLKKDPETIAWDEPVEMLVWDDDESGVQKEMLIYGKFKGQFMCENQYDIWVGYKHAKPILPTIKWDEFKEGEIVEMEHEQMGKCVFYITNISDTCVDLSSSMTGFVISFPKSDIKSIRKLK